MSADTGVGEPQVGILEQVSGLVVDFERVLAVQQIEIEQLHTWILTTTNDYTFPECQSRFGPDLVNRCRRPDSWRAAGRGP